MATRWDREQAGSGPLISGFSGVGFKIDGTPRPGGVLLTPESAHDWIDPPTIDVLGLDHLASILSLDPAPEFLILGTGATMRRPVPAFTRALDDRGIGLEPMDSRAAARAWGVLRSEDRWVVAALYPLG